MNNVCQGCYRTFEETSFLGETLCSSCVTLYADAMEEELKGKGIYPDADLPVCQSADRIIDLFTSLGFTTNTKPDVELLRHSIVEIIQGEEK